MSQVTTVLLSSTSFGTAKGDYDGTTSSFASPSYKGAGYYGGSDLLHTVSYDLTGFVGEIIMQGSIIENPADEDFAFLDSTAVTATADAPYTGSTAFNFSGNYCWLRVYVNNFAAGTINRAVYNF